MTSSQVHRNRESGQGPDVCITLRVTCLTQHSAQTQGRTVNLETHQSRLSLAAQSTVTAPRLKFLSVPSEWKAADRPRSVVVVLVC